METQSTLQDTAAESARQGGAARFRWLNDPNSTVDFTQAMRDFSRDTFTASGIAAVNLTDEQLPEVGLFVPFVWPRIDNPDGSFTLVAMDWSNGKQGWFTSDFNGTGVSLLVTLEISGPRGSDEGRLLAGRVAEGDPPTDVFGPTSTELGIPFPEETLERNDRLPFIDLNGFAPGEAKLLDFAFNYEWGDDRPDGSHRTAFAAFTVAPVEERGRFDDIF